MAIRSVGGYWGRRCGSIRAMTDTLYMNSVKAILFFAAGSHEESGATTMAMSNCLECGHSVSSSTNVCSGCRRRLATASDPAIAGLGAMQTVDNGPFGVSA